MRKNFYLIALVSIVSMSVSQGTAFAKSSFLAAFKTKYQASYKKKYPGKTMTIAGCTLCHTSPPSLNAYGKAYRKSGRDFSKIKALDSDGDGFSNLTEIMAFPEAYPGNKASHPDATRPVVKTFALAAGSAPNTATITAFTATDNVKVTGYKVTETATAPKAGDAGWTASKPVEYTFASAGDKSLHAWAKDAAGNVSLSREASVTVAAAAVPRQAAKATKAVSLIPLPAPGEQVEFSYAPVEDPAINADPATAMPIGVGPVAEGGDTINLQVSFAQFAGPVDVYLYLTLSTPAGDTGDQFVQTQAFNPSSHTFELISGQVEPWKSGVVELNENIWANLPVSEFPPGNYRFVLGVTPAGQYDSHYTWSTDLTIK